MKNWKQNIIKFLKTFLFFSFAILFVVILISASFKNREIVCAEIVVNLTHDTNQSFITKTEVKDIITNQGQNLHINNRLSEIDLSVIESRLEKNPYIKNAEVFTNFDGILFAKVGQNKPLYRVFNNSGVSYYVSETSSYMPISSKFTPRLIVITGNLPDVVNSGSNSIHSDLKILVEYLNKDEFLKALIGEVRIVANQEFELYPKLDGHRIEIGSLENLEKKLNKLKTFYQEALLKVDWEKYKTINLKYEGQIVCTKK